MKVAAVAVLVVLAAALGIGYVVAWEQPHTASCQVTGTDRTSNNSSGKSDARIYTADCGVLTVGDDLWHLAFNSADTYGALRPGHRYQVTYVGWRLGLTSTFPNIIAVR